jgi:hypothetical protein
MLDANINIIALSNKLLSDIPSSIQTLECTICTTKTVFHDAKIILNELLNSSGHLEDINKYLNKYVTKKKEKWCPNCKKISGNSKRVLQVHILLETDVFKDNMINENKILVNDISSKLFAGKER